MERCEFKINQLKETVDKKQEHIFATEDEIDKLKKDIEHYKSLQERLPKRHYFPWEEKERRDLLYWLKEFIKERAKVHKRTSVAIASQIHHQKWLIHSDNFIEEDK